MIVAVVEADSESKNVKKCDNLAITSVCVVRFT